MAILNTFAENKFQLLVAGVWEDWIVMETFMSKFEITRYTVGRLLDETEHNLPVEKVEELYNDKKLKLC